MTTQRTPQKSSITQRLWTDLGRSVGVTSATKLVWLAWFVNADCVRQLVSTHY